MSFKELSKEQQIMVSMRKTLSSIIREITPEPGTVYPLTEETVKDIRMCLALITAREQELGAEKGLTKERPYFSDEEPKVVPITPFLRR
ncbi:segregation and condensation protein A [Candidatus Marithrix sp. Canyon 246]|uniref:segregation and condensation protein A n=1 Tax=Candidatus Marithrix sp. Canyon 246 TaxID=1827136 RepID=UPI00084A0298|nr:segregation and condensation protein A [Candidatus Marithrix sp. Canyon 246]